MEKTFSDSTFNETFEEALPELELSVQISGGEFWILEDFKFPSLNNMD